MPDYCAVPLCKGFGGFHFPKDPAFCKKWQIEIRRQPQPGKKLWEPSIHSVVCANHFKESDFYEPKFLYGEKRRRLLKKEAIPSLFAFNKSKEPKSSETRREGESIDI